MQTSLPKFETKYLKLIRAFLHSCCYVKWLYIVDEKLFAQLQILRRACLWSKQLQIS